MTATWGIDALGNVTGLNDHLGDPAMQYRYDAFGNLFSDIMAPTMVLPGVPSGPPFIKNR